MFSRYREIKIAGLQQIDHAIFSHVVKTCIVLSFGLGKSVYASVIKQGFESFSSVGNSLMDFYAKSGVLSSALGVFNCVFALDGH